MSVAPPTPAYRALAEQARAQAQLRTLDLFTQDAGRAERFAVEAAGLYLDYSKQPLTDETLRLLTAFAEERGLPQAIQALLSGEKLNSTEGRAALHTALRRPEHAPLLLDGGDVMPQVAAVLRRMGDFAGAIRKRRWLGAQGDAITDVVNIGIGGSDRGPRLVCRALRHVAPGPRAHFVSNLDAAQLDAVLAELKPASTLFVICSKTFTTGETLSNARLAKEWLVAGLGSAAVARHMAAVSTNLAAAQEFGIPAENVFGFWDWVGGRYSLWSAVGLVIALSLGMDVFRRLLAGAQAMDQHFAQAPLDRNMPVLLALIGYWHSEFRGVTSQIVLPYAQALEHLPGYLQQLELESNGKSVTREGAALTERSIAALWGDVGTDAQHAFMQWVHQGSYPCNVDFILPLRASHPHAAAQRGVVAHCLAQSETLLRGKSAAEVRAELKSRGSSASELEQAVAHRVMPGNRPSSTLLLPELSPESLGALLALYEHKTFAQGWLWNVNSFDQWGVEYGKRLAERLVSAMQTGDSSAHDGSTRQLLLRFLDSQKRV
ncbi:MAG: glucose-6-phosphate isomerase [Nevskiales bacterium]